jgi:hypothetical protein
MLGPDREYPLNVDLASQHTNINPGSPLTQRASEPQTRHNRAVDENTRSSSLAPAMLSF